MEFKTGRPRAGHRRQLELYRDAAAHLFPGATIDAHLVYATEHLPPRTLTHLGRNQKVPPEV